MRTNGGRLSRRSVPIGSSLSCCPAPGRLSSSAPVKRCTHLPFGLPIVAISFPRAQGDVDRLHESVVKRLAVLDGGASSLRVRDMKALVPIVEGLFSNAEGSGSSRGATATSSAGLSKRHAQLQRQIQLEIVKIGLKDAPMYVRPHIAVTISQQNGRAVESTRQTAAAKGLDNLHLLFNEAMVLRTPLEDIPQDAAIFFEFKHFKEAKKKTSTRCYAFMETDEITEGGKVLELYRKPTDWTRKRVHLHSVKPLYLHVNVSFNPIAKPTS